MMNLEEIAERIESEMDEKDEVREVALKSSRSVIKLCSSAIRSIHKGKADSEMLAQKAGEELEQLTSITRDFPDLFHSGFVESAMQEYAETRILEAIYEGNELPEPDGLGVTNEAYLLGIGDVIGEVRRMCVDSLRHGEMEKASKDLTTIEELYEFLMRFHYPSGMVAIKRKQDVARGVLEKTRGEIAVASRAHALEQTILGAKE